LAAKQAFVGDTAGPCGGTGVATPAAGSRAIGVEILVEFDQVLVDGGE
jgi:hypothetical protein